jgi:hypothetical protein
MPEVGALEFGHHDRHPQELDELRRRREEGEGDPIPGALALWKEPNYAACLPNLEHGPDGLEVRHALRLWDCPDELQQVALEHGAEGLVGRDPVYGVGQDGAHHEGIPVPHVVCQDEIGWRELLEYPQTAAVKVEAEPQVHA